MSGSLVRRIASFAGKVTAGLVALSIFFYAATASAAPTEHYTAFGWHSTQFDIQPFPEGTHDEWNKALRRAVDTWNASHDAVYIQIDESSRNTIDFADGFAVNDGREAEYRKICLPTGCWFEIKILGTYESQVGDEENRNTVEYFILHELGHALGLNDFIARNAATRSVMAFYVDSSYPPRLQPYDRTLIKERIRLIETNGHQLIPTLALGVIRPAAQWVASTLNPPPPPAPLTAEQIAFLEADRKMLAVERLYQRNLEKTATMRPDGAK